MQQTDGVGGKERMMRFHLVWAVVGVLFVCSIWLEVASANSKAGVFYLDARPGQCLIATRTAGTAGHKYVTVVPCANARHNFEVFAIRHGGWGAKPVPANAPSLVYQICRSAYVRATGHPLRGFGGVDGFWADPGAEQARYGDKVICSYILYNYAPLGAGRHLH